MNIKISSYFTDIATTPKQKWTDWYTLQSASLLRSGVRRKLSRSVLKPSVGGNIPRLGQQSVEFSISLYAKVDPDEDADAVAEFLWHQAKNSVKAQAAPVLESVNYRAQMQHKVGGLAVEPGDLKDF